MPDLKERELVRTKAYVLNETAVEKVASGRNGGPEGGRGRNMAQDADGPKLDAETEKAHQSGSEGPKNEPTGKSTAYPTPAEMGRQGGINSGVSRMQAISQSFRESYHYDSLPSQGGGGVIKPYYSEPGITIYHGDCLEILPQLPDKSVDLVLTDPPFSSGARLDAGKSVRGSMVRGAKWEDEWFSHDNLCTFGFLTLMRLLGRETIEICKNGAKSHWFIDWRMYPNLYGALESCGWVVKNLIVWDKGHFGMGTNYRNQHELILYAEKGDANFPTHGTGNVIQCDRVELENHPTEKPTELIGVLLKASSVLGETILDPFMGSGTTLVAAKQLGRKAIGIEIEEKYCEIAIKRLGQEVLQL